MHQPLKFTQEKTMVAASKKMIPPTHAFSMARRRGDIRIVVVEIDVAAAAGAILAVMGFSDVG
jgi:hypothetical protein